MKTLNVAIKIRNWRRAVVALTLIMFALFCNNGTAQIQQAWAVRYNNGITNGTNQALKMALDPAGSIYITGFSQNANTNLGYVTIKYAPNGNQLWAARYDSTNYPSAAPAGLVLDTRNNAFVTGNALTIKYDSNGNQLWAAPYNATAIATDGSNNIYIAGVSNSFETIKLNPSGSNLWTAVDSGVYPGPKNLALAIAVDPAGNAYVAGDEVFYSNSFQGAEVSLAIVAYNATGGVIWRDNNLTFVDEGAIGAYVGVTSLTLDAQTNLYVELGQTVPNDTAYYTFKIASNGSVLWTAYPASGNGNNTAYGMAISSSSNLLLAGQVFHMRNTAYGTIELNTNGSAVWTNLYPAAYSGMGAGMGIAIDSANNCYVTGYSPGTNSANDIVTIKYDSNGNQIWLQRYNGPANGNDGGNAIAVDNNGNVYVTGSSANASGGTDIVTIKYSPLTLQRRSDGTVLLQGQGSPGESFDIQASADLRSWLDLGSVTADTNGLMQFDDTNASNYNARFYYTSPQ